LVEVVWGVVFVAGGTVEGATVLGATVDGETVVVVTRTGFLA
jgi:hypothetical protein